MEDHLAEILQSQHLSAGAYIDTLPSELLAHIFLAVEEDSEIFALDVRAFRWIAGQVCSRWRKIALFSSPMWQDLTVEIYQYRDEVSVTVGKYQEGQRIDIQEAMPKTSADIIREHLLRSRNCPITLSIHCSADNHAAANLLAVIGAHSEQWKEVTLDIHSETIAQLFFTQINRHLSRLEKLAWFDFPPRFANIIVAPILRDITIPNRSCTRAFPNWSQLQCITFGVHHAGSTKLYILDDLRILQESQRLTQLNLYTELPDSSQPELEFKHLRALLCCSSTFNAFLELPVLEELHLTSDRDLAVILRFIQQKSPTLVSLTLPGLRDANIITDILDFTRTLTTLDISRIQSAIAWSKLMRYLFLDSEHLDRATLPNLRSFSVSIPMHIDPEMTTMLIDMVNSRFSDDYDFPRLRSLEWWGSSMDHARAVSQCVEKLEKRALKVTRHRWYPTQ
ncbi:hypothetical protein C8J56DRAFT_283958 [Mycena floridula]|nr:hypothetical protein C8J56DRAFT_283958 [Mycena floridula]